MSWLTIFLLWSGCVDFAVKSDKNHLTVNLLNKILPSLLCHSSKETLLSLLGNSTNKDLLSLLGNSSKKDLLSLLGSSSNRNLRSLLGNSPNKDYLAIIASSFYVMQQSLNEKKKYRRKGALAHACKHN